MTPDSDFPWLQPFLYNMLSRSPVLAVYLVGIVLALVQCRKHPGVCLLTFLGLAILVANSVATDFLFAWVPHYLLDRVGSTAEDLSWVFRMMSFGSGMVYAVGFSLLLLALFSGRGSRLPRPLYPPPELPPQAGSQEPYVRDLGSRAP